MENTNKLSEFQIIGKIGDGSFSSVYKGKVNYFS